MSRKKIALRILAGLIIITTLASVIAYFALESKPGLASFIACCGGVLDFNLLVTLFLVNRNFKN